MEELEQERSTRNGKQALTPEHVNAIQSLQSLKLARTEFERQREATAHPGRKAQLAKALEELDRRMAEVSEILN